MRTMAIAMLGAILVNLTIILALIATFLLVGCGGSDEPVQTMTIGQPDCSNPKNCV